MILRGGLCGAELHMCLRLHFTVIFPEYFTGTQDLVRVGDLRLCSLLFVGLCDVSLTRTEAAFSLSIAMPQRGFEIYYICMNYLMATMHLFPTGV